MRNAMKSRDLAGRENLILRDYLNFFLYTNNIINFVYSNCNMN